MPDIKDFVYYDENDTTQTTKTTVENTPQTSEYWTSKDSNDVKDKLNEIIGEINQFTTGKDGTDGQDGKDGADADNDAIATALSSDTDFITAVAESVEPETIQKIDITDDPWYERQWSTDDILKKVEVQLSNGDVFEGVVEYFNGFYQISFTGDFERDIVFNTFAGIPFAVVVANDINATTVADAIKATDEWDKLGGTVKTQLTYVLLGAFEYNPDTKTATYTAGTLQIKVVVSDEPLEIEKVILWEPASEVVSAEVDLSNYYNKQEVDSLVADASVDLSNYFNKSEINTLLAAYETQDQLDQRLANYYNKNNTYSKTEVDALVAGLGSTDLSDYYTKDESDDKYAPKQFAEFRKIPNSEWKQDMFDINKHQGLRVMVKTSVFTLTGFLIFANSGANWNIVFDGDIIGEKWLLNWQSISIPGKELRFYDDYVEQINNSYYALTKNTYVEKQLNGLWIENKEFKEVS